jgi:hypothetical protein
MKQKENNEYYQKTEKTMKTEKGLKKIKLCVRVGISRLIVNKPS